MEASATRTSTPARSPATEVALIDHKLDHYMANKARAGGMTHLLIDRFRFDSFAPDSDEAGSNLLTRFGELVYLFLMITPPELAGRARVASRPRCRPLQGGRRHPRPRGRCVRGHAGAVLHLGEPDRQGRALRVSRQQCRSRASARAPSRSDGTIRSTYSISAASSMSSASAASTSMRGSRNRSIAIDRCSRPRSNTTFLVECVRRFREVNFADRATGRVYARIESGRLAWTDAEPLASGGAGRGHARGPCSRRAGRLRARALGARSARLSHDPGRGRPHPHPRPLGPGVTRARGPVRRRADRARRAGRRRAG